MKARNLILTAGAFVALAAPAAQPAGAMIQSDGGSAHATHPALHAVSGKLTKGHKAKSSATAIKVGAYNAHAYVPGGASSRVAKAITAVGKRTARTKPTPSTSTAPRPSLPVTQPAQSGGSVGSSGGTGAVLGSGPDACSEYNLCTPEELCTVWGEGCLLLENPIPAITEVSGSSDQLPQPDASATDAAAGSASSTDTSQASDGSSSGSDPYDTSYLYQDDC